MFGWNCAFYFKNKTGHGTCTTIRASPIAQLFRTNLKRKSRANGQCKIYRDLWMNLDSKFLIKKHGEERTAKSNFWEIDPRTGLRKCDQIWQFFSILVIFGGVWQQFFCPKSPVYKSLDVDILGFGKFIYVFFLNSHLGLSFNFIFVFLRH